MMSRSAITLTAIMFASSAMAAERYTEARITQVETSDVSILLFLQVISGDAPPTGNGGSNEPVIKSYLLLATTPEDVAARKHLLSGALIALTTGAQVRFRWEDTTSRIVVMMVRAN